MVQSVREGSRPASVERLYARCFRCGLVKLLGILPFEHERQAEFNACPTCGNDDPKYLMLFPTYDEIEQEKGGLPPGDEEIFF